MLASIERRFLFFPALASDDWVLPEEAGLTAEDVDLKLPDGTAIHAWWCPAERVEPARTGAILFCHGNAGNLSHRAYLIAQLVRSLALPVFIFDYPGYGRSGGVPGEKTCYAAAAASADWLVREKGIPPDRLVLFGESLGGGVAVEMAVRCPHRALAVVRTFTSIPDVARVQFPVLPLYWFVRNRFDNLAKIDRVAGPTLIAHGDCDRLIPFSQGERLFAKAREPKEFLAMPGCDHNDPLPPAFYEAFRRLLARSLSSVPTCETSSP